MTTRRVLVVDDDENILDVVALFLRNEGYEVETAANADEALLAARTNPPDIAILDLMLPGTDGFDICDMLRQDPVTKDVRVVMLTALTDDVSRTKGLLGGASTYLTKPFAKEELLKTVRTLAPIR